MSDENYYRESWMSGDQWECAEMFARVRGGFHHLSGKFKECGRGIEINEFYGSWATFDGSDLTRLVIRSHDHMIRTSIHPSGPGRLKFTMFKRHSRDGGVSERHPTIEDAIKSVRRTR